MDQQREREKWKEKNRKRVREGGRQNDGVQRV